MTQRRGKSNVTKRQRLKRSNYNIKKPEMLTANRTGRCQMQASRENEALLTSCFKAHGLQNGKNKFILLRHQFVTVVLLWQPQETNKF